MINKRIEIKKIGFRVYNKITIWNIISKFTLLTIKKVYLRIHEKNISMKRKTTPRALQYQVFYFYINTFTDVLISSLNIFLNKHIKHHISNVCYHIIFWEYVEIRTFHPTSLISYIQEPFDDQSRFKVSHQLI